MFYPSITEKLLSKALDFASNFRQITSHEREIILHAKRSLLFSDNCPWEKKSANNQFDVTMGSFDGAETCELVGCYLLSLLTKKYGQNIGLYREDGLAAFSVKPREMEKIKKGICKVFRDNDLKITVEANTTKVNFLDVTLDLRSEKFYPYMKEGNIPLYVHKESNHPPSILKNIPKSINKRLPEISSDKESFDSAKGVCQEALNKSGYHYNLSFTPSQEPRPQNSRRIARARQQTSGNAFFHLSISISLNLTPIIKFAVTAAWVIITKLNSTNRRAPIMKRKTVIAGNPTRALWMETATRKMSSTRLKSPLTPRRKPTSDFVTLPLN